VNLDVRDDAPVTSVTLNTKGVQVGPLLHDMFQKDALEGALESDIALEMKGDGPEMIKQTLNGKGNLVFSDGAIVGIDLAGMVRNVASQFGIVKELKPKQTLPNSVRPLPLKTDGSIHPEPRLFLRC
jgi:AsmA protein